MNNKKILFVCREPDYSFGGANKYIRDVIEICMANGYDITEIVTYNKISKNDKEKLNINYKYIFKKEEQIIPNINKKRVRFVFDMILEKWALKKFVKNNDFNLIIYNYPLAGGFKIDNIPTISIQHISSNKIFNFKTRLILGLLHLKNKFYYSDYIVNFSKFDTYNFSKNINKNNIVYKQFYVPCHFKTNDNNKGGNIVYIGRISKEQKRIDLISKLSEKIEGKILVVGAGEDKYIKNVSKSCEYLGYKSSDKIKSDVLPSAKALILLSDYEGMPIVCAEALSQGIPLILRDTFDTAKFLIDNGNNGIIFNKNDSVEKMAEVINNTNFDKFNKKIIIKFYKKYFKYSNFENNWKNIVMEAIKKE